MTDGWGISCKIALRRMLLDFTDDKSTLVQVMAWCRQATSHYLSQCWPRFMSPYGVTGPQWVKGLIPLLIDNSNSTDRTCHCHEIDNWYICTVEYHYNTIQYTILHTAVQKLTRNIIKSLNTNWRHPILRPHGRAMGCLLWGLWRKTTTL